MFSYTRYRCSDLRMPRNHGKLWSRSERSMIRNMWSQGYSVRFIAKSLGRSHNSIRYALEQ